LSRFIWLQAAAFIFSARIIRAWRPDLILGFGGFTTAGIIVVAALFRRPVVLHEANRVPGRAIRLLGGLARRLYLPPGVRLPGVRMAGVRHVGLPVRPEIVRLPREAAQSRLGLDPAQKVLVILGGSQGASSLNRWVRERLERLAGEGIQVCCVTGPDKGGDEVRMLRAKSGQTVKAVFMPFCDDVATLLSAADLVVSRAGAGTIAELIRCATPAILVPFPQAADNHQWANARFFEQQGGGIVVDQEYLADLDHEVRDVIFNDWLLHKFRANLQRMDRVNSLDFILDDLEGMASPGPAGPAADPSSRPSPPASRKQAA
jgi:UDP-N-acetylglucosamine--N-acetylmuramyl-(pentapeptide) pyrophosphoryl-undecaprenol N-acetylglucosamine transferase